MRDIPPSLLYLINRIEHYKDLERKENSQAQKIFYELIIYELQDVLDEITGKSK